MTKQHFVTAREAAQLLNISLPTLYAYVSRGMIRSESLNEKRRTKRYYTEDIEYLLARKDGRKNPEKLVQDAMHWGAPILPSAITLIENGKLYYRGQDIEQLIGNNTIEDIAILIWEVPEQESSSIFQQAFEASEPSQVENLRGNLLQQMQTALPQHATWDVAAYDLRPKAVKRSGARILWVLATILGGTSTSSQTIAQYLCEAWELPNSVVHLIDAALILCADHELNASSFTARIIASTQANPYAVVEGGLAALQGKKHGGFTQQIERLFYQSEQESGNLQQVLGETLRQENHIPGFGHALYPNGDPRARLLLSILREQYSKHSVMKLVDSTLNETQNLIQDYPTLDFSLVALTRLLQLPDDTALGLFALGRAIGWIGHAIEEYESNHLIRPRAKYVGVRPTE